MRVEQTDETWTRPLRDAFIEELVTIFTPDMNRLIFGTVIYPTRAMSYRADIKRDLKYLLEQVFRRSPPNESSQQVKRLFVVETDGNAGRHCHFILEVPPGVTAEACMERIAQRWMVIALKERRMAWAHVHGASTGETDGQRCSMTTSRPLTKTRLVDDLETDIHYCLKSVRSQHTERIGELCLDECAEQTKGHRLTLCLW